MKSKNKDMNLYDAVIELQRINDIDVDKKAEEKLEEIKIDHDKIGKMIDEIWAELEV